MQLTRKCFGCKQDIRKDEMIQYSSLSGKTSHWYCKDCYEEKMAREKFQNKVCQIFGLKSPGPRIWTERKRLRDNFGYTDDAIVDCLDYIYNVKRMNKLAESLALVTPRSMMEMKKWRSEENSKASNIVAAMVNTVTTEETIVTPQPKKQKRKINLDDALLE